MANQSPAGPLDWAERHVAGTFAVRAVSVKGDPRRCSVLARRPYTAAVLRRRTRTPVARSARPLAAHALALGLALVLGGCSAGPTTTPPVTPGTSAHPREVNIVASDYAFSPPFLDLVPGETVVFHLINGGLDVHEAVIGDQTVQDAWETAEANLPPVRPGVTPSLAVSPAVSGLRLVVRSGERNDVTWTVPTDPAAVTGLIVGCHIAGHYAKGMHVPVRIAGPAATTGGQIRSGPAG